MKREKFEYESMMLNIFNFLDKFGLTVQKRLISIQSLNSALAQQFLGRFKLVVVLFLLLSGCSNINNDIFLTKEVPVGKVGSPYYAEIKMKEYAVIEDTFLVVTNIDQNSGLMVSSGHGVNESAPHAMTKIEGTPMKSGIYKIIISGTVRDGLKDFNQDFILRVEE
ncbi:hypothetical protein [Acinetobacter courvalinii]|uniref:hypothetical protein n=1 Tax=Acinetobacter courvalinii TaxID=280147 RepID=UPI0021D2EA05|nr:hypothetical protein [Acinetobacter courvalinii]MCU4640717.1 hypothetical protein [Acinetobacter courvalinii]